MNNRNKTLMTLGMLNYFYRKKKDYMDIYIPFIGHILCNTKYFENDLNMMLDEISSDLSLEFGLTIPRIPLRVIFGRAKREGLITQRDKSYYVVAEKCQDLEMTDQQNKYLSHYDILIIEILEFFKKESIVKSYEEIENILLSFLENTEIKLNFKHFNHDSVDLTSAKIGKKDQFLMGSFVLEVSQNQSKGSIFEYLLEIWMGCILATTISYSRHVITEGSLQNLQVFIDTRIILALLGYEGEIKKNAFLELCDSLKSEKAKLCVFEHTYDEIVGILEKTKIIHKPFFDYSKASIVSRYFHDNKYSETNIDLVINTLKEKLKSFEIDVISAPNFKEQRDYLLDEFLLKQKFIEKYKLDDSEDSILWDSPMNQTIDYDIKSIVGIHKLRQGVTTKNIREAKYIFVSTNKTLAYVSKIGEKDFNSDMQDYYSGISCVVTDSFLGTLIWLTFSKNSKVIEKNFIAYSCSILKPSKKMIAEYLMSVENLVNKHMINEKEVVLLKTMPFIEPYLMKVTLGDDDTFEEKNVEEILAEIRMKEKKEHEKEVNQKNDIILKLEAKQNRINTRDTEKRNKIDKFSKILSRGVVIFLSIIFIFSGALNNNDIAKTILWVLAIINMIFGFSILKIAFKVEEKIRTLLLALFLSEIDK